MWKMLSKESKGIHVGDVDLLTFPSDCENALREVLPIETGINPPLPCLRVASDRSASEEDSRAVTTIQVKSREAKIKGLTSVSTQIDVLLPLPLCNIHRN